MRPRSRRLWSTATAVVLALVLAACGAGEAGDRDVPVTSITTTTTSIARLPQGCDDITGLFAVSAVLDAPESPCGQWVGRSYGRAVRGATGSASVWSRRPAHGTALIVGAVHTLGQGWFGPADTAVVEAISDPGDQTGVLRLFLALPNGSGPDVLASPWFGLYNPSISAERNSNLMQDVLPREDFYVAVTDSQKLDVSGLPPTPERIVHEMVPLYDPSGDTTTNPTWAEARIGDLVLLLGYPNDTGELTASVGRVLSDDEASRTVAALADLGDSEGSIPYEAEVEIIIQGTAVPGMSGGPVIDGQGRLAGIIVRATDEHDGVQYVRAVRMSYVVSRLTAVFDALTAGDQEAVLGYLEPQD